MQFLVVRRLGIPTELIHIAQKWQSAEYIKKLEKRNQDTPSFEIGETVEVKKGRAHSGAVGYAILVDIKEDEIILQGFNKHGEFLDSWHNNIENIKKVK